MTERNKVELLHIRRYTLQDTPGQESNGSDAIHTFRAISFSPWVAPIKDAGGFTALDTLADARGVSLLNVESESATKQVAALSQHSSCKSMGMPTNSRS